MDAAETLFEEFENRQEPIHLAPYETCPYKDICPYSNIGTSVPCYGTYDNRNWDFICDLKELKKEGKLCDGSCDGKACEGEKCNQPIFPDDLYDIRG